MYTFLNVTQLPHNVCSSPPMNLENLTGCRNTTKLNFGVCEYELGSDLSLFISHQWPFLPLQQLSAFT